jgi:hypothetical protein
MVATPDRPAAAARKYMAKRKHQEHQGNIKGIKGSVYLKHKANFTFQLH